MNELRHVPPEFRGIATPIDHRRVYALMAKSRALEERLIKMAKSHDGYFWIGGPGEEAFNTCLGLLVKKGQGPAYDYLHLHYRSSAILMAMGAPMLDFVRQMASRATDPYSGGRNFVNHPAIPAWNVVPGSSPIEVQYSIAPGTALAQLRHGGDGITIVNGGDAGTAEGDFATCMNWISRPGRELPVLMIVTNNQYGISTPYSEVQGSRYLAQRAEPYGIRWDVINGNDPVESWQKLSEIVAYVRKTRRPFALEAQVSRLHGHSSSSGAARNDEEDCLERYRATLIAQGIMSQSEAQALDEQFLDEGQRAQVQVREEPLPTADSIYRHVFAGE